MAIRMSKRICIISCVLSFCLVVYGCQPDDHSETPQEYPELEAACHWIEGGGSQTTGGAGGKVYVVTTLSDELDEEGYEDAGSLRYAVEATGARTIIFKVAGIIHLRKPLVIEQNGNITIAGQTAPGDGICIADYPLQIKKSDNVIVRFLRFRMGEKGSEAKHTEYDAVSVNDCKNVVLDHLSCSWSVDECVSCYGNENFTMQYCIVSESLKNSSHPKGAHGYAGIWGGQNASFHHNLLAHHDSRNPRFDHDYVDPKHAGPIDLVNNVVYNWGNNSAYGGEGSTNGKGGRHINFVNNYFKPGPSTESNVNTRLVDPWTKCSNCTDACGGSVAAPKIYLVGNTMIGSEAVTADNWKGSTKAKSVAGTDTRWTEGMTALETEQTAAEAYETVLAKAGCSLQRDAVDQRIINDVRNGSGRLIDTPSDVGGWPNYTGEKKPDSDGDGIPDEWEEAHGLNPKSYSDGRKSTLVEGFTNFDVYLNAIVAHLYQ